MKIGRTRQIVVGGQHMANIIEAMVVHLTLFPFIVILQ